MDNLSITYQSLRFHALDF